MMKEKEKIVVGIATLAILAYLIHRAMARPSEEQPPEEKSAEILGVEVKKE